MNKYLTCLRLNLVLLSKLLTCRFLNNKDYAQGYNKIAQEYDKNWLCYIWEHTEKFLQKLPPANSSLPILDLGCGTGFSTDYLARHYNGNPVIGIDISSEMLKKAKEKSPQLQFVCDDMLNYLKKQPDKSAAIICSSWAIGYSNPQKIAAEAHRVLEPGGTFAFIVNTIDTLPKIFDAFRKTMYNHPQHIKKLLWPRFPKDFSFVKKQNFEELYSEKNNISIPIKEEEIADWVFKTGIMSGFEQVTDMAIFRRELQHCSSPLTHRHIIGIYRKK